MLTKGEIDAWPIGTKFSFMAGHVYWEFEKDAPVLGPWGDVNDWKVNAPDRYKSEFVGYSWSDIRVWDASTAYTDKRVTHPSNLIQNLTNYKGA